jgi:hypothetical protein
MTDTVASRLANQLKRALQRAQAIAHATALLAENMDDRPRALAIQACARRVSDRVKAAEDERMKLVRLLDPPARLRGRRKKEPRQFIAGARPEAQAVGRPRGYRKP